MNITIKVPVNRQEWEDYCAHRRALHMSVGKPAFKVEPVFKDAAIFGNVASSTMMKGRAVAGNSFAVHRCTLRSVIKRWLGFK